MASSLKGDMGMTFNIPMVMTAEKLYVKVPNIPFFPIPENVVGKFLELDLKELAEQEGTEWNPDAMDAAKTQSEQRSHGRSAERVRSS